MKWPDYEDGGVPGSLLSRAALVLYDSVEPEQRDGGRRLPFREGMHNRIAKSEALPLSAAQYRLSVHYA